MTRIQDRFDAELYTLDYYTRVYFYMRILDQAQVQARWLGIGQVVFKPGLLLNGLLSV